MKKTYSLPEMNICQTAEADILTLSYIQDETNRENIVIDPFAPRAAGDIVLNHQNA